jgi:hypothetical protein
MRSPAELLRKKTASDLGGGDSGKGWGEHGGSVYAEDSGDEVGGVRGEG